MCDCCEEKERREREQARKAAARRFGAGAGGYFGPHGEWVTDPTYTGGPGGYYGPDGVWVVEPDYRGPGGYYGPDGVWVVDPNYQGPGGYYGPDGVWVVDPNYQGPGGYYGPDGVWVVDPNYRGPPPKPRFSPVQIVLGSTGFLFALFGLILKTIDNNKAHAILSTVGLGHLIPYKMTPAEAAEARRRACLEQKKRKWQLEHCPKPQ